VNKNITILAGDGIGPEIVKEAVKVLDKIGEIFGHCFNYEYVDIGGCSIDKYGVPITDEAMEKCKAADSVLLGAVGGPKWDNVDAAVRPEKAGGFHPYIRGTACRARGPDGWAQAPCRIWR